MHLGHGNLFGDIALEAAYAQGDEWLEQLLNYIGKNCDYVVDFLNKNIPQIKTDKPEGTYLMWLDCRQLGLSRQQLDQFMIEKAGLALNSGYIFGDEGEGFMRLNVASPFSVIAKAMKQLKQAVNTLL
jgi:cystathionine beta-lyase